MNSWTSTLPYFSRKELADPSDDVILLDNRFAANLCYLRKVWGRPLFLTSCCRTDETNERVDGHPHSLHLIHNPWHPNFGCMAADIWTHNWTNIKKFRFQELAHWKFNFSVIWYEQHVHIDSRDDLGLPKYLQSSPEIGLSASAKGSDPVLPSVFLS
jgi:hypothetical protein